MEIKKTLILDATEPASKAMSHLIEYPAVIVTKGGKYYGIIDHRNIAPGMRNPANVRCETIIAKPPVLRTSAGVLERVDAFLVGHFKALPVVEEDYTPLGITTRVELLADIQKDRLVPKEGVSQLMSAPVFTIDEKETLAKAKKVMNENKAGRLVVTRNGYPEGVVSAFDIASWATGRSMAAGRKDRKSSEISPDDLPMVAFLRPEIASVEQNASLDEAIQRMIEKGVSAVIVTSGRKAVGVLSAVDIFKKIQDMVREPAEIAVSGLDQDTIANYPHIKEKIGHVMEKFGTGFNVRNLGVHVKEQKSTFVVSIYLETDEGRISLKEERGSLRETVDELAVELEKVLRKKKEMRRPKPRVTRARGRVRE